MISTAPATFAGTTGPPLLPLPVTFAETRAALQRVATHVLARRRHAQCGKFGLRATPGGFGTPACGPEHKVVRVAGSRLVRETTGSPATTRSLDLATATLAEAADFVGVALGEPFEVGHDTPSLGDPSAPLPIDATAAQVLAAWFAFGSETLDAVVAALDPEAEPTVIQLWPEHFDVGVDIAAGATRRMNLGASPGDSFIGQPYLYVGPWDDDRPGDAAYWNAPFGAVVTYEDLRAAADPASAATAFLRRGVDLVRNVAVIGA